MPVKIQCENETIEDAVEKIEKASKGKGYQYKIVIQTKESTEISRLFDFQPDVEIIKSLELQAKERAGKQERMHTNYRVSAS